MIASGVLVAKPLCVRVHIDNDSSVIINVKQMSATFGESVSDHMLATSSECVSNQMLATSRETVSRQISATSSEQLVSRCHRHLASRWLIL